MLEGTTVRDLALLEDVTPESICEALKVRYLENHDIYTYIGNVLISMNPFQNVKGLSGTEVMAKYKSKYLHENPPHVYAITDMAYTQMCNRDVDQAIIITGESGAGKTEAAKILMRYLSSVSGNSESMERIRDRLMLSNPVLESFGNAKTIRNDNSSRFGKYLNILFDHGVPVGGEILTYMLEKSRVVDPGVGERNFHIFYQVVRGTSASQKASLKLLPIEEYTILNVSGVYNKRDNVDENLNCQEDIDDFLENMEAMRQSGMSEQQIDDILSIVSGILRLGQVQPVAVTGNSDKSEISNPDELNIVATLLGVSSDQLGLGLTVKTSVAGRDIVKKNLPYHDALVARDSLAKVLYSRVFDWLVHRMNGAIDAGEGEWKGIGVLDIYGFEIFEENSFEQFCINFVNEKLQQVFIEKTLKEEQEEYSREGITWFDVPYFDNKAVCQLIEGSHRPRTAGLFTLLCETCKFPKGDDRLFVEKINKAFQTNNFYSIPKGAKFFGKSYFIVEHYAGHVQYNGHGFVEKNRDEVTYDHLVLGESSSVALISECFPAGDAKAKKTKKTLLAGEQFMAQVGALCDNLNSCEQYFCRCLKPNETRTPFGWDTDRVQHQIAYLGLLENIRIRRAGFAYKRSYDEFYHRYRILSPRAFPAYQGTVQDACGYICDDMGLSELGGYQMGRTKIFIKEPSAILKMESEYEVAMSRIMLSVQACMRMGVCKLFWKQHCCARLLQSLWRGCLVRRWMRDFKKASHLQASIRSANTMTWMESHMVASKINAAFRVKEVVIWYTHATAAIRIQNTARVVLLQSWNAQAIAVTKVQAMYRMQFRKRWWYTYFQARKIQSLWRTYYGSKEFKTFMGAYKLQVLYRGRQGFHLFRESFASRRIVRWWRTSVMRKHFDELRASRSISSSWKAFTYSQAITMNQSARIIVDMLRIAKGRIEYVRFKKARLIQSVWRGFSSRRSVEYDIAAVYLQAYMKKMFWTRYFSRHIRARSIQRRFKAIVARSIAENTEHESMFFDSNYLVAFPNLRTEIHKRADCGAINQTIENGIGRIRDSNCFSQVQ